MSEIKGTVSRGQLLMIFTTIIASYCETQAKKE